MKHRQFKQVVEAGWNEQMKKVLCYVEQYWKALKNRTITEIWY